MFIRLLVLAAAIVCGPMRAHAEDVSRLQPPPTSPQPQTKKTDGALTDAAIIALIVAGSIAIYKATGHPCACPSDLMRNGQACGGRSAWSKPGGAKPLCFPTDVTASMISSYRSTKAIPAVW